MALEEDPSLFAGKIVLMGYMGLPGYDPMEYTKYYTPMNEKYAGKARPDMYEIEVQANIISMYTEESFIHKPETWINVMIGLVITLLSVYLFYFINSCKPVFTFCLSVFNCCCCEQNNTANKYHLI